MGEGSSWWGKRGGFEGRECWKRFCRDCVAFEWWSWVLSTVGLLGKSMGVWSLNRQAPQPCAWQSPPPTRASTAASYWKGPGGAGLHTRCQLNRGCFPKLEGSGGYPRLSFQHLRSSLFCCPPSLHNPRPSLQQKSGGKARQQPVWSSLVQSSTTLLKSDPPGCVLGGVSDG